MDDSPLVDGPDANVVTEGEPESDDESEPRAASGSEGEAGTDTPPAGEREADADHSIDEPEQATDDDTEGAGRDAQ